MDSIDGNVLYESVFALLVASNRIKSRSVESLVLKRILEQAQFVWKDVMSQEDRDEIRKYAFSEKPVLIIKNNLSSSQVASLLNQLTKETCPVRAKIPQIFILTMETVSATNRISDWISDSSSSLMKSDPTSWLPSLSAILVDHNGSSSLSKTQSKKRKVVILETHFSKSRSNSIIESASHGVGIDMSPIPSSKAPRPAGVHVGPPMKPKPRITFNVHGDSQWTRLKLFLGQLKSYKPTQSS